jgi:hypothetical protein
MKPMFEVNFFQKKKRACICTKQCMHIMFGVQNRPRRPRNPQRLWTAVLFGRTFFPPEPRRCSLFPILIAIPTLCEMPSSFLDGKCELQDLTFRTYARTGNVLVGPQKYVPPCAGKLSSQDTVNKERALELRRPSHKLFIVRVMRP